LEGQERPRGVQEARRSGPKGSTEPDLAKKSFWSRSVSQRSEATWQNFRVDILLVFSLRYTNLHWQKLAKSVVTVELAKSVVKGSSLLP
jgi:hypothetical protein